MQHQTIRVNGIGMRIAVAGEGRPLVLLHGFPDTHEVWREQFTALSDAGYRVIAPDLRGYGGSDAPAGVESYRIDILRADVLGLFDAMQVDQAYLVGHDWGAVLGWQLCMHAPARVERFAALSVGHPNAYAQAGLAQRFKAWYAALFQLPGVAEAMLGAGDLLAMKAQAVDDAQLAGWRRNFAGAGRLTAALNYYRANRQLATASEYPDVTTPVLGLWSEGDPALTENQMSCSGEHMSGPFRYEKIAGDIGHWLQLREPTRVNRLLIDFGAWAAG